jgi:hypothetical protein
MFLRQFGSCIVFVAAVLLFRSPAFSAELEEDPAAFLGDALSPSVAESLPDEIGVVEPSTSTPLEPALFCDPMNPALFLDPTSQSGHAGSARSYTVRVYDRDSLTCLDATFTLSAAVPEGWSSSFSQESFTLSPGYAGLATWTVTPPADTPNGTYDLTVRVSDASSATHASEYPVTFVVFTDLTPPAAQISSPLDGSRIPKNGRVKVQGSAIDNTGITTMEVSIDGEPVAYASAPWISFTWYARSAAAGAHKVTVKAYDSVGNSSAASVTVVK